MTNVGSGRVERIRLPVVVGVVIIMLLSQRSIAEIAWSADASAAAAVEWSDNPRMNPRGGDSVVGANVSAGLDMQGRSEVLALNASGSFRSLRYDKDEDLNRDDQFIDGSLRREYERQSFDLDVGLDRESTLTSELESTGLVKANKRRTTGYIGSTWLFEVNEEVSLRIGGRYSDIQYQDAADTGLVDYSTSSISASSTWLLSEIFQSSIGWYLNEVRTPLRGQETDSYGWQGVFRRELDANSFATFKLGTRRTRQSYNFASSLVEFPNDGWLIETEFTRELSSGRISGGLARTADPSGGVLQQRDRIYGSISHEMTAFTGIWLRGDLSEFRELAGASDPQQRDYRRFDASYYWQFSPGWRVTAAYIYAWQQRPLTHEESHQYTARLGISWNGEVGHP